MAIQKKEAHPSPYSLDNREVKKGKICGRLQLMLPFHYRFTPLHVIYEFIGLFNYIIGPIYCQKCALVCNSMAEGGRSSRLRRQTFTAKRAKTNMTSK